MSSKLFTTVLALVTVVPFAYFATQDAVRVTDTLRKQTTHIQQLSVESQQLDQKLDKTVETKEQVKQEVQQVDKAAQDAINERKKLEAELGAN